MVIQDTFQMLQAVSFEDGCFDGVVFIILVEIVLVCGESKCLVVGITKK